MKDPLPGFQLILKLLIVLVGVALILTVLLSVLLEGGF